MTLITAYGQFPRSALNKEIDWDTDVIKAMLVTSGYTFNKDAHRYKSSITNEVAATGGYVAGGFAISSAVATYDNASDTTNFDAADLVIPDSTITARGLVLYNSTPATDATRPLILYVDFETDQISVGADFTVSWHSLGIFGFAT